MNTIQWGSAGRALRRRTIADMDLEIPVAATLPRLSPNEDPIVVEANPDGGATRAVKALARHVYRLVQEFQWSDHDGAVVIAVAGDTGLAPPIGPNLALLLAPLVTTAVGERAGASTTSALLEAQPDSRVPGSSGRGRFPSPRDRVWVVPDEALDLRATRDLFELVLIEGSVGDTYEAADVVLVAVPSGEPMHVPQDIPGHAEVAAVFIGGSAEDAPPTVRIAG
jgi:hypothetical protein